MGEWLARQYYFDGITFQNWMVIAVAIIVVAVIIAWWRTRD
jgi:hypothetical protein